MAIVLQGNGKGVFKKKFGVMFLSDIVDKRRSENRREFGNGECKSLVSGRILNRRGRTPKASL